MSQLNDTVCEALDSETPGFSGAVHLQAGMAGTEFETSLGEIFALERSFGLIEHLQDLFLPEFVGPANHRQRRDLYISSARKHLKNARRVLRDTFFDEFGGGRVDPTAAANAWSMLANALQVQLPELFIATTNYDPSATRGLEHLGYVVRRGFSDRASEPRILEPDGSLSEWRDDSVAVVHLHGAVGWYRTDQERIEDHGADHPKAIEAFGPPALLYPEPNKDPDRGVVRQLWAEFDTALSVAGEVLVVGHSLADDHLVERLRPHAKKVAVLRRADSASSRSEIEKDVRRRLVGARVVWGKFGPDGFIESDDAFRDWWGAESGVPESGIGRKLPSSAQG
jgi:hypothetical protein